MKNIFKSIDHRIIITLSLFLMIFSQKLTAEYKLTITNDNDNIGTYGLSLSGLGVEFFDCTDSYCGYKPGFAFTEPEAKNITTSFTATWQHYKPKLLWVTLTREGANLEARRLDLSNCNQDAPDIKYIHSYKEGVKYSVKAHVTCNGNDTEVKITITGKECSFLEEGGGIGTNPKCSQVMD